MPCFVGEGGDYPAAVMCSKSSITTTQRNKRTTRNTLFFLLFIFFYLQQQYHQGTMAAMYEDANFADLLVQRREKAKSGNDVLTPMADLTQEITTIDGNVYSQLLLSGAVNMMHNKPTLNKINVFPIADGDTGTNMVNCLKNPVRNLFADRTSDLKQASSNLAADVVVNGQGNSGGSRGGGGIIRVMTND